MSMIEIIRELDAMGLIVQIDSDEHLAEALTEIGAEDEQ